MKRMLVSSILLLYNSHARSPNLFFFGFALLYFITTEAVRPKLCIYRIDRGQDSLASPLQSISGKSVFKGFSLAQTLLRSIR